MLITITIIGLVFVPLSGWMGLGFRSSSEAAERSAEAASIRIAKSWFLNDVRGAELLSPFVVDCAGGEGAGVVVAAVEWPIHTDPADTEPSQYGRVVYTRTSNIDGTSRLWRRQCEPRDSSTDPMTAPPTPMTAEVVLVGRLTGASVTCLPDLVVPGVCRGLRMSLTLPSGLTAEFQADARVAVG